MKGPHEPFQGWGETTRQGPQGFKAGKEATAVAGPSLGTLQPRLAAGAAPLPGTLNPVWRERLYFLADPGLVLLFEMFDNALDGIVSGGWGRAGEALEPHRPYTPSRRVRAVFVFFPTILWAF